MQEGLEENSTLLSAMLKVGAAEDEQKKREKRNDRVNETGGS